MGTVRWQVIAERVFAPAAGERRVTLFARVAGGEMLVLQRDRGQWTPPSHRRRLPLHSDVHARSGQSSIRLLL